MNLELRAIYIFLVPGGAVEELIAAVEELNKTFGYSNKDDNFIEFLNKHRVDK